MEMESKTGSKRDLRFYMTLAVAATIVLRLFIAADPPFDPVYAYLLALPYAAFVYPLIGQMRTRRILGLALLLTGFALVLVLSATKRYSEPQTASLMVYLLMLLFVSCICYPMAFVQPQERAKRSLDVLSGLFIGLIALLSLLGVITACTGNGIPSFAGADYPGIGSVGGRLYAYLYPSAFALAAGLALLLTPRLFGSTDKKLLRVLLLVAVALLYLAMALTGATVLQLVFAVCAGGFVYLLAGALLSGKKTVVRVLLSLVLAVAAMGVCFGGQWAFRRAVKVIAPVPDTVSAVAALPTPQAPETQAAGSPTRKLAMPRDVRNAAAEPVELGFVELRLTLWRAAARLFAEHPLLLVSGTTAVQMADWLAPYLPAGVSGANMRFLPMQALVAYGLPGAIIAMAFVLYVLFHAARLFFCGRNDCSIAERSIALVPLFCLLVDCTDCYLTLTDTGGFSALWFFLAAGYIVLWSRERIAKK